MVHLVTKALPMQQRGQSMVEYVVVVFFGLLLLLAPLYDPDGDDDTFASFEPATRKNAAGRNLNAIEVVGAVIKDNYAGYTYAMSVSEYPNLNDPLTQKVNDAAAKIQEGLDAAEPYIGDKFSADSLGLPTSGPGF